jgi:hypothetical protein
MLQGPSKRQAQGYLVGYAPGRDAIEPELSPQWTFYVQSLQSWSKLFDTSLYRIDATVPRTDKELVVALVKGWPIFWVLVQLFYRGMQEGR